MTLLTRRFRLCCVTLLNALSVQGPENFAAETLRAQRKEL
jgi:hypothetical protein